MRPTALILAALLATTALLAQVSTELPADPWVFTPAFASQYMFRGVRLGGPSLQPALEYGRGPWVAGVWGNLPLKDKVAGQSDPEFDFYGSYTMDIAQDLTLVPGLTFYTYPGAKSSDGFYPATIEPNLAVNCMVGPVRLTPKFFYDVVLRGPTVELSAAMAVPLPTAGTEIDFAASIGTFRWTNYAAKTSPAMKNWGDYWLLGVAAPYRLPNGSKITVGWAYTAGAHNYLKQGGAAKAANPAALGRGVLTISYTWIF